MPRGHQTPEQRKRQSEAISGSKNGMFGKTHSSEAKDKMRQARLGGKHTEEHKAKISAGGKGRVFSEEHKRKIALSRTGEKNPSWKGGITPITAKERQRFSMTITPLVFARDNYTCQMCEQYGGKLHADHIKSWSEYPELRFDIDNCRTLCRACHYYITFKKKMPNGSKWGYTTVIRWREE